MFILLSAIFPRPDAPNPWRKSYAGIWKQAPDCTVRCLHPSSDRKAPDNVAASSMRPTLF